MGIDKNHPLYSEYIAECRTLFDEASRKEHEYENEYPNWIGQDHPNGDKINAVIRERNRRFHEIQKKYGFLQNEED